MKIYHLLFVLHTAFLLPGLIISGGDGALTSIETFPADDPSCNIPPFPGKGKPLIILFSSQGRYGHSLSVVENGRQLVACGGWYTGKSCISWRCGQDGWTHYATLR